VPKRNYDVNAVFMERYSLPSHCHCQRQRYPRNRIIGEKKTVQRIPVAMFAIPKTPHTVRLIAPPSLIVSETRIHSPTASQADRRRRRRRRCCWDYPYAERPAGWHQSRRDGAGDAGRRTQI